MNTIQWKSSHTITAIFGIIWYVALDLAKLPVNDTLTAIIVNVDKTIVNIIPAIAMGLGFLTGSVITPPVMGKKIVEKKEEEITK